MFWFAPVSAQGQNREPGLQENSVRNFTGRQILYIKSHLAGVVFYINRAVSAQTALRASGLGAAFCAV